MQTLDYQTDSQAFFLLKKSVNTEEYLRSFYFIKPVNIAILFHNCVTLLIIKQATFAHCENAFLVIMSKILTHVGVPLIFICPIG